MRGPQFGPSSFALGLALEPDTWRLSFGGCVVAAAGLHLVFSVVRLDADLAVGAVMPVVGRRVPEQILRAQLIGDLAERGGRIARVVHLDDAASSLLRELLQDGIAAEAGACRPVEHAVCWVSR